MKLEHVCQETFGLGSLFYFQRTYLLFYYSMYHFATFDLNAGEKLISQMTLKMLSWQMQRLWQIDSSLAVFDCSISH